MKPPLLLQADLVGSVETPTAPALLPVLSELNQAGVPLVLMAARPDRWAPTRNRVDRVFLRQATIESDLRRAGGALDAIVYLDFGLFSRKRQHERSLADIANRYACTLADLHLIARPCSTRCRARSGVSRSSSRAPTWPARSARSRGRGIDGPVRVVPYA